MRRARDPSLLDALEAFRREPFAHSVWRAAREGRDPAAGAPSRGRWCDGGFDVLSTSLEEDGALAEIHALLSAQPVFPSKDRWLVHRLRLSTERILRLADLPTLARLGVDVANYSSRDYARTREIADAAYFLDFDGLLAPSARWNCLNAMLFTERIAAGRIEIVASATRAVDWPAWRKRARTG